MQKYSMLIIACLTLGLAPFVPEPHIWGKAKWITGGANGMALMDWWDTILHGSPWAVLLFFLGKDLFQKLMGWAGPKGLITGDTVFLSSYHDDPKVTPQDELVLDLCMTISPDTEVEGEIQKKILPGGKYAVMHAELSGPDTLVLL